MFHTQHSGEPFSVDVAEDVLVIQLAGGGFVSARVISHLEIGDFAVRSVDIRDDIALVDLLVIDIEKDFAAWAIDRAADFVSLCDFTEEHAGVVSEV